MRVGAIWFSCERDLRCLEISRESVEHHVPGCATRVVMDTGNRGVNLNGKECIADILEHCRRFSFDHGLDYVLKIDSDTVCFDRHWERILAPQRWVHVGQSNEIRRLVGCYGAAYFLHRAFLDAMPSRIDPALKIVDEAQRSRLSRCEWPEDKTISALAELLFPRNVFWVPQRQDSISGLVALWQFVKYGQSIPTRVAAQYWQWFSFVEFGRRVQMGWADSEEEKVAISERAMRRVWELSRQGFGEWLEF